MALQIAGGKMSKIEKVQHLAGLRIDVGEAST